MIGEFEQLVLLAILRLGDGAYGAGIRNEIERCTGRSVGRGQVYTTLDRLEAKGCVSSAMGVPSPVPSGKAKRYYSVEEPGVAALKTTGAGIRRLWSGLEDILGEL
jgi:DNA-binding PadR family transcriptional regulator